MKDKNYPYGKNEICEKEYLIKRFQISNYIEDYLTNYCHTILYRDGLKPKNLVIISEQAMKGMEKLVEASYKLKKEFPALIMGRHIDDIIIAEEYVLPRTDRVLVCKDGRETEELRNTLLNSTHKLKNYGKRFDAVVSENSNMFLPQFLINAYAEFSDDYECVGFDHSHPRNLIPSYDDIKMTNTIASKRDSNKVLIIHKIGSGADEFRAYIIPPCSAGIYESLKNANGDKKLINAIIINNLIPLSRTNNKKEISEIIHEHNML